MRHPSADHGESLDAVRDLQVIFSVSQFAASPARLRQRILRHVRRLRDIAFSSPARSSDVITAFRRVMAGFALSPAMAIFQIRPPSLRPFPAFFSAFR